MVIVMILVMGLDMVMVMMIVMVMEHWWLLEQLLSLDQVSPLSGLSPPCLLRHPDSVLLPTLPTTLSFSTGESPLCGLFSHGQNATKLDQGGFRLGTSPSIHIYLEVVVFVPFMESI